MKMAPIVSQKNHSQKPACSGSEANFMAVACNMINMFNMVLFIEVIGI
jgi:hypothetical protein